MKKRYKNNHTPYSEEPSVGGDDTRKAETNTDSKGQKVKTHDFALAQ